MIYPQQVIGMFFFPFLLFAIWANDDATSPFPQSATVAVAERHLPGDTAADVS